MSLEIGFLLVVLVAMVYLFLTGKLPIDLAAFLALVVLLFTGYLEPHEAFTGFASTAVITMLSLFILGSALESTGLAGRVGRRLHAIVGAREVSLMVTIRDTGLAPVPAEADSREAQMSQLLEQAPDASSATDEEGS